MFSDVWSYAVFMWELMTAGCLPYPTSSNEEVVDALKSGDLALEFTVPDPCAPSPLPPVTAAPSMASGVSYSMSNGVAMTPHSPHGSSVANSAVTSATSYDTQFLEQLAACMSTDPRNRPTFDSLYDFMTTALRQEATAAVV